MGPSERVPPPEEAKERLGALADLEAWLSTPMHLLSAVWLGLVVASSPGGQVASSRPLGRSYG